MKNNGLNNIEKILLETILDRKFSEDYCNILEIIMNDEVSKLNNLIDGITNDFLTLAGNDKLSLIFIRIEIYMYIRQFVDNIIMKLPKSKADVYLVNNLFKFDDIKEESYKREKATEEHTTFTGHTPDIISVNGLIFNKGKLLVQNHIKSRKTILPGGKIEPGETKEKALIRELKEELGITVTDMEYFDNCIYYSDDFIGRGKIVQTYYYIIKDYDGTIQNMEPDKHSSLHYINLKYSNDYNEVLFNSVKYIINIPFEFIINDFYEFTSKKDGNRKNKNSNENFNDELKNICDLLFTLLNI